MAARRNALDLAPAQPRAPRARRGQNARHVAAAAAAGPAPAPAAARPQDPGAAQQPPAAVHRSVPAPAAAHDPLQEGLEIAQAGPRRGNNPPQLQVQGDVEANEHPAGVVAAIRQEDEYEMFPTVKQVAVNISNLPLTLSFEDQTRLVMKIQEKALDLYGRDSHLEDLIFVKKNDCSEIHLTVKSMLATFKICQFFNHSSSRDFPGMELKASYEIVNMNQTMARD